MKFVRIARCFGEAVNLAFSAEASAFECRILFPPYANAMQRFLKSMGEVAEPVRYKQ
jgi:hypothetical protein